MARIAKATQYHALETLLTPPSIARRVVLG